MIMDTLESLLALAKRDDAARQRLLKTKAEESPLTAFCREAALLGYPIGEMDLIFAGEEAYAAMRRSTNGGGENSPALAGEDDYYELFMAQLEALPGPRPFEGAVGVFDSGAGGLSVLAAMKRELPSERFVYFGDSAYTPYGSKTEEWVRERSFALTRRLAEGGIKALVIACNTATAAAVKEIRAAYPELPVIGVEPALKVAVDAHAHLSAQEAKETCRVLVMATRVTLQLEKYHDLAQRLAEGAVFYPVACDGLAERIERGDLEAEDLHDMLMRQIGPYKGKVESVVLGCTHYPLIRKQIRRILGDLPLYDGSLGTARELKRRLAETGRMAPGNSPADGSIEFLSSKNTPETFALYREFLTAAERAL